MLPKREIREIQFQIHNRALETEQLEFFCLQLIDTIRQMEKDQEVSRSYERYFLNLLKVQPSYEKIIELINRRLESENWLEDDRRDGLNETTKPESELRNLRRNWLGLYGRQHGRF